MNIVQSFFFLLTSSSYSSHSFTCSSVLFLSSFDMYASQLHWLEFHLLSFYMMHMPALPIQILFLLHRMLIMLLIRKVLSVLRFWFHIDIWKKYYFETKFPFDLTNTGKLTDRMVSNLTFFYFFFVFLFLFHFFPVFITSVVTQFKRNKLIA